MRHRVGSDQLLLPALAELLRGIGLLGEDNEFGGCDEMMLFSGGPLKQRAGRSLLLGPPMRRFRTEQPPRCEFAPNHRSQDPLDGRVELGPPPPPLMWQVESWARGRWETSKACVGDDLASSMAALEGELIPIEGCPGTIAGAFAYDLMQWTQDWALLNPPDDGALLGLLFPIERWLVHDRAEGCLRAGGARGDPWLDRLGRVLEEVEFSELELTIPGEHPPRVAGEWSNMDDETHADAVRRVQRSIASGQLYQLNFGRKWHGPLEEDPWTIQCRLLLANPAPWSCYLNSPDLGLAICSSSPEMLVDGDEGRLCTSPIKGTKPRGLTIEQDAEMARELLDCPKERAEHLMLVDLERNDMTMICKPGSVSRTSFNLESYIDVHHLVSEVQGELREDRTIWHALQAMFPGGSISGCPKTVTMAAIDQLEGEPRSFWTGSMGIMDHITRSISLNILIRTLEAHHQENGWQGTVQAGGGLVIGSDPQSEVEEAKWKAAALRRAVGWIPSSPSPGSSHRALASETLDVVEGDSPQHGSIGGIHVWPHTIPTSSKRVAFIDNLDSFSWNIANSLALLGADVVIVPGRGSQSPALDEMLTILDPTHIVIGPGPGTPGLSDLSMDAARRALLGTLPPLLGVCLGHQALGVAAGWPLVENRHGAVHGQSHLIEPAGERHRLAVGPMTRYHSLVLDPNQEMLESSALEVTSHDAEGMGLVMSLRHDEHAVLGVQFHPESAESVGGGEIFRAFLSM